MKNKSTYGDDQQAKSFKVNALQRGMFRGGNKGIGLHISS